ncbi:MAG: damage-control phosphatase ARMT1 family protein [Desulfotomaculales bacterium]
MRVTDDCYGCLEKLITLTASLATEDVSLRKKVTAAGLAVLDRLFPYRKIPTQIAAEAQRVIRNITGNRDPFAKVKEREMTAAAAILARVGSHFHGDLPSLIGLAALGNAVDFFKDLDDALREMLAAKVGFSLDHTDEFCARTARAGTVLYIADNAGEVYFDLPLLTALQQNCRVVHVVKESPVQNDLTRFDLRRAGLEGKIGEVITTGTASPGFELDRVSPSCRKAFDQADLVVAKGMGNYETLSEIDHGGKVFYILKAKCGPVARALGVPLDSFVAAFI